IRKLLARRSEAMCPAGIMRKTDEHLTHSDGLVQSCSVGGSAIGGRSWEAPSTRASISRWTLPRRPALLANQRLSKLPSDHARGTVTVVALMKECAFVTWGTR